MRETRIRSQAWNDTSRGGPDRVRTDDLLDANQALSQLSYGPMNWNPSPQRRIQSVFENRMDSRNRSPSK